MKPAKMKPLSPIMERHTPQHPLPEEIKKLAQDETVCQFCGVSYLIHHEIKKLEDQVALLQDELEKHEGAVEREEKLRAELEKSKSAIEQITQLAKEKDSTIEQITKEIEEAKIAHSKLQSQLTVEKQETVHLSKTFKSYKDKIKPSLLHFHHEVKGIKTHLNELRSSIHETQNQTISSINEINGTLPVLAAVCIKDYTALKDKNSELTTRLESGSMASEAWKSRAAEYEKEISSLKRNLQDVNSSTGNRETQLHDRIKELEALSSDLSTKLKTSDVQQKMLQTQMALMDDKLKKKQTEQQNTTFKLQKTEESANKTILRLNEDCSQLERELAEAQEDLRRMRNAQKERERKEQELHQRASLSSNMVEEVKAALSEAKSTNKALIEERALMITSHQNQIQQLRENFKRKLEEAGGFPEKVRQELELAEERHKQAMAGLEKELREEFNIALSVEKDKHSEAMTSARSKHKSEIREMDADFQKELSPYRNQVASLSQKVEILTSNMEEKQKEFEEEKDSLKKIITALEMRITELTAEEEDEAALKKLQVVADNQKMQEILTKNEALEQNLISMKEEIGLLQDTVRRECEERFELTEALSQARSDLKASKVPNSLPKNGQATLNPVSAVNKLNPNGLESEPSSRLSGQTLRSLELDQIPPKTPNSMPSLRSLPDLQPRRESSQLNGSRTTPSPPYETNAVSTSIKDLSFGAAESPTRSRSDGSHYNGHTSSGRAALYNSGGTKALSHSKSADSVDNVRRRIAAAIKRK